MTNHPNARALHAFAAMGRLPDDYILAAERMLYEAEAGISRPEKPRNRFLAFLNSGLGAAVISGMVALAILAFVIRAGQTPPTNLPHGGPVSGTTEAEKSTIEISDTDVNYSLSMDRENYPVGTDRITVLVVGKNKGETVTSPGGWYLERITDTGAELVHIYYTEDFAEATPEKDEYASLDQIIHIERTPLTAGRYRLHATEHDGGKYVSVACCEFTVTEAETETQESSLPPHGGPVSGTTEAEKSTIEISDTDVNYSLSMDRENYPVGTDRITVLVVGKNKGETVTSPGGWYLERITDTGAELVHIYYTEEFLEATPEKNEYASLDQTIHIERTPLTAGRYRLHATEHDGGKYVSVAYCEFTVTEAETVDKYGFYEGNEVIFSGRYSAHLFEDDPLFTDGNSSDIFGPSSDTKTKTIMLSGPVPAPRHIGDLGYMDPFTIHYRKSVLDAETGEILYHTYAFDYMEFDYSPDGQLLEFRDPADSMDPLPHEEAIALSKQFLEAVGIELSDDYVPYARDGCGCYFCGQHSEFTFVYWTREIGGVAADGYLVWCGDAGRVKRFIPVNTGMYEKYGYISQEQVDHTRARLLEALSRTDDYYDDPYHVVEGHERGALFLGSDGNLYLGIHISGAVTDLRWNYGYLCMRVNP